jgi:hypothetical protein
MYFACHRLGRCLLLPAVLCLGTAGAAHDEHEHRHEGKHVHGSGELNLAQDGDGLYLELHSPAANIVGFEHAPKSEDDRKALDSAVATLNDGDRLFAFNPSANCHMVEVKLDSMLLGGAASSEEHEHENDEDHEEEHGHHADFDATYLFRCGAPERLESLEVRLFQAFPGTHELQVQYVVGNRQGAAALNPQRQVLNFHD